MAHEKLVAEEKNFNCELLFNNFAVKQLGCESKKIAQNEIAFKSYFQM